MRILQVCSEYPPQKIFGLGRYVSGLAREQAAQGHSVHVLTNSLGGVDRDLIDQGVHIHRIDFPPPPMPPTSAAPVMAFNVQLQQRAWLLGRGGLGNPEVVVSHDWLTAIAGHRIAKRLELPHIFTVHDTVHGKRFGKIEELEDRVAHPIEMWAVRQADLILVNSRAIGEEVELVHGARRERVELLHPGIDAASGNAFQDESRLKAFRSVLARPDEQLVTFAGRLDLEKGVDTLINAFAILRDRHPKSRLIIAGRGILRPAIEDHLRQLHLEPTVFLAGYLEGEVLRSLYKVSDVHVCPSHYEPFGLVALEAMAAATPVVVSDTGGLRDIVTSGEVGRRFPVRDAKALADALLELLKDDRLRKSMGEAGKRHVIRSFSWSHLAKKSVTVYTQALETKNPVTV